LVANPSLPRDAIIRGRLIGLDATEEIKSPFEALYLRRVYNTRSHFDFLWLIMSRDKLPPGTIVNLYLDRSSPEHEDLTVYELPIANDFYDAKREVTLTYDRRNRRLLLKGAAGTTVLNTVSPQAALAPPRLGRTSPIGFHLVELSHARIPDDIPSLSVRLQSDDPVIRVQERSDLAQMGQDAIPYIEEILTGS